MEQETRYYSKTIRNSRLLAVPSEIARASGVSWCSTNRLGKKLLLTTTFAAFGRIHYQGAERFSCSRTSANSRLRSWPYSAERVSFALQTFWRTMSPVAFSWGCRASGFLLIMVFHQFFRRRNNRQREAISFHKFRAVQRHAVILQHEMPRHHSL